MPLTKKSKSSTARKSRLPDPEVMKKLFELGIAAANQGRFWEFHDAVYGAADPSSHPVYSEDSLVAYGDWNILLGGNGKDVLRAVGDENRLYGGNGVDRLIAIGEGNLLDGGNGADLLFSTSRGGFGAILQA